MVDNIRTSLRQCLVSKLDFEKAYDKVSWSFLEKVLQGKGLCPRWRSWISCCLATSTFSVILTEKQKSSFMVKGV